MLPWVVAHESSDLTRVVSLTLAHEVDQKLRESYEVNFASVGQVVLPDCKQHFIKFFM